MEDKKGFTLVELLAVIVVLAIIMVIATMSANKTIIKTKTKAYDQSMDTVVKSAKQILQTGNLDNDTLKSGLDYSTDEYNVDVKKSNDSYLITLTATKTGKFNNMDFDLIDKNKNYFYEDNTVCTLLNDDGTLKKPDKCTSSSDSSGSDSGISKTCTSFTKKDIYSVGDVISFCNESTGKSEDFYVINDNGDTVFALAKNVLIVKSNSNNVSGSEKNYGLQEGEDEISKYKDVTNSYYITAPVIRLFDTGHGTYIGGGTYIGSWENSISSYPADVSIEDTLLLEPLQNYEKYFKNTLNKKSVSIRLINSSELKAIGCNLETKECITKGKEKFHDYHIWWTAVAHSDFGTFSVCNGKLMRDWGYSSANSIRPVIEINKSELK